LSVVLVAVVGLTAIVALRRHDLAFGGPVSPPSRGAYFGITRYPTAYGQPSTTRGREQSIDAAEDAIGRRFDIDHQFYRWGDLLPNEYLRWTADHGRVPYISLNARARSGALEQWSDIAAGHADKYLHSLANSLRAWGRPALFTFHHEPEGGVCRQNRAAGCDRHHFFGVSRDYIAAWRHIVDLFRDDHVTTLSYVWVTNGFRFDDPKDFRYGPSFYPGDDVIDWIGADPFNFFLPGRQPDFSHWTDLSKLIGSWYAWAQQRPKPLMLAEFGSLENPTRPGGRAAWFAQARRDLKRKFRRIRAIDYYDAALPDEVGYDWRLFERNPRSLAAYAAWGEDPYFNP